MALAGEVVSDYDLRVRTAAGPRRWINISTLTFPKEGNGACPLLVHLFRDATTRVRNERFIEHVLHVTARLQSKAFVAPAPLPARLGTELTPREEQVLSLLAEGLGTQEIADRLSISSSTVRNHVRNILSKFQVHSRLEAVVYALQHGLLAKG
jgi:DNA-binding CsgD family transcriptional regulator